MNSTDYTVEAYLRSDEDDPFMVHSSADVDALIDQLLAAPSGRPAAILYVTQRPLDSEGNLDHALWVAIDGDGGIGGLHYWNMTKYPGVLFYSRGAMSRRIEVSYYHTGHELNFPRDSEISIPLIRRAVNEFLCSGGDKPTCLEWQ
ncbi:Imm1 family immunity protein [Streptomyces solisilvae]|uniref:Imm1 family immunity protein n=1 Tax=Streptomyces malaysiensis TaxID=92644 RepID=UPI0036B4B877